jgi:hypothetical protein
MVSAARLESGSRDYPSKKQADNCCLKSRILAVNRGTLRCDGAGWEVDDACIPDIAVE